MENKWREYWALLHAENAKYNLSAITDWETAQVKHFEDSLLLANVPGFHNAQSLCDIGSGAGFPGVPLKIAYPALAVTLVEANRKKCRFLKQLIAQLALSGIAVHNARAETLPFREKFDIVTGRAVTSSRVFVEIAGALVKVGGMLVLMKGAEFAEELAAAEQAFQTMGFAKPAVLTYVLSDGKSRRALIYAEKSAPTPEQYPRPYHKIIKNML